MIDILIIGLYYISMILSLLMVKKITGAIFSAKLFNIVYLFFVIFIFFGGIITYLDFKQINFKASVISVISIIFLMYLLPVGYLFSKILATKNKQLIKKKEINKVEKKEDIYKPGLFLVMIIVSITSYIYYTSINVPLIHLFTSEVDSVYELAKLRSEASNDLDYSNKNYVYKFFVGYRDVFLITTLTMISGYFYLKFKHNKNVVNLIILLIFVLPLIFNSLALFRKSEIIFIIMYFFFLNYYDEYKNNNCLKINFRPLLKIGTISILLLIPLYGFFMNLSFKDFSFILQSIFDRTFLGGVKPLFYYFYLFPTHNDYLLGKSFTPTVFSGLFNYEVFPIEKFIYLFIFPQNAARGIVGTAPTMFIGEIYANFGFLIMLLSIILVGFLIGIIEIKLESLRYSYMNVSFYITVAFLLKGLSISSIEVLISFPLILSKIFIMIITIFLILKLDSILKIKSIKI